MSPHPRLVSRLLGWTMFSASLILLLGAIGAGAVTYEHAYEDRVFPGVRIGSIPVGGLTKVEASTRVQRVIDARLGQGMTYVLDDNAVTINPVVIAPQDPDLSYQLVEFDVPALVDAAFATGRQSSFAAAWTERVRGALHDDLTVPLAVTIDRTRLEQALTENFRQQLQPMEVPRIQAHTQGGTVTWSVTEGRPGRQLDIAAALSQTSERVITLDPAPIIVRTEEMAPPYTKADLEAALPTIHAALRRAPITLTHGTSRWTVDAATLATWFTFPDGPTPTLGTDPIDAFLAPIAPTIERGAENGRLTINPNTKRVHEFRAAQEGVRIDRDALRAQLHDAVFGTAPPLIPIPTVREAPSIAVADTNDLGIRELLGVGRTSFRGSPPNRRHNIGIGTALLNGILIAPDETFSLVGALSPFDASSGYRTELVIKGNRTIPEFGGGLCQVATTMFRVALAAGLPIVERTNHAYRVPYYEPPVGMDATIYGPKPDFTFRNDTGHHLLLRTRVIGDELEYELWGTRDGRVATSSEPEISNYVTPPPTRIVETEDLPPGQKKCTERAHTGADAKFTYTVTFADGRKDARVFKSHYRPWQAVCLVGKEPVPSSQPQTSQPTELPAGNASAPSITIPSPAATSADTPPASPTPPAADVPLGGAN